jgi:hypothetical protein
MIRKDHKFFELIMENDLDELYEFLSKKQTEILDGLVPGIPEEELSKYNKDNGATTQLGNYYNIFDKRYFGHDALRDLHRELRATMKVAAEYYEIDYDANNYMIHGWYNLDPKTEGESGVNPIKNDLFMHDHMGGEGIPTFHGYYCVNAEPSSTYYKIGGPDGELFENINKNNRAIISETGHPHGRDDWYEDKPRITIAYDIAPADHGTTSDVWIPL